ncbi:MAG: hypothetical protein IKY23_06445 [Lachnospiraceae bacterium]|nr:hypothetical protein [Lachnospiraceae bacterium]
MQEDREIIRMVYIDDSPETELSKYLDSYHFDACKIIYEGDIVFKPEDGYESLINNQCVREANIILIDSKLFENRSIADSKFTGEEFKLILRKHFPFIEVIVVTQNEIEDGFVKIPKYNPQKYMGTASDYYKEHLPNKLNQAVRNILDYRKIAKNLKNNKSLERVLVEKITNSLEGTGTYDELTKTDIDKMVEVFKEVQEALNAQ